MADAFYISGYLADITVDGQTLDEFGNSAVLAKTRTVTEKPAFGVRDVGAVAGQSRTTLAVEGHAAPVIIAALDAAYENADGVDFTFQIGEQGADTDAGAYAGSGFLSGFTPADADADGQISFSFELMANGAVPFTAPTP